VNVNDPPSAVTISENASVGNALLASQFTDADGTEGAAETGVVYTWQSAADAAFTADVQDLSVRTTPNETLGYLVQPTDVDRYSRVDITYTDAQGTAETIISNVTNQVTG